MQVDRSLYLFSAVLTFFVRVGVVGLSCIVLSRLLRRPKHRFLVWLLFSLGSTAYWCATLAEVAWLPSYGASHAAHPIPLSHFTVPVSLEQQFAAVAWFLMSAYLVGVFSLVGLRLWSRLRLRQLLRFGSGPSPEFATALETVCQEFGVKPCELIILPGIASPATIYWWKPRIILPEICHRPERLDQFMNIMRHELVHIRRRDFLVSSLMDALCNVLFFHPALWMARKRMRMERELACDLAVVAARPDDRADYAASLAQFVRLSLSARNSTAVQFAAPASLLGTRIRSILREPIAAPAWNRLCSAALGLAMVAAFTFSVPQLSITFDLSRGGPQLASERLPVMAQRMKRHIRFDIETPPHSTYPMGSIIGPQ